MAKTPVTLEVKDYATREVLKVSYEFEKSTDNEGQVNGIARGGLITVRLKPLNDGTPDMMAWMVDSNLKKDGSITFLETTSGNKMKSIDFKEAFCIHYAEHWADGEASYEEIIISCKSITFGNITYEYDWK